MQRVVLIRRVATQSRGPDRSEVNFALVGQEPCGQWMPRKKATCARMPGHAPPCMTAENMASRRAYRRNHLHPESPESRKKSNRKYRISLYGLTQEQFGRLLEVQGYACGMCHAPFGDGQTASTDRQRSGRALQSAMRFRDEGYCARDGGSSAADQAPGTAEGSPGRRRAA
jgi:hypothetical protein